jgi:hypothetical protein
MPPYAGRVHNIGKTPSLSVLAASALLILCPLVVRPADVTCPSSPSGPINTSPSGPSGSACATTPNFFNCNVGQDGSGLSCYGIQLQAGSGSSLEGDLNSVYYTLFHSIANALTQTPSPKVALT